MSNALEALISEQDLSKRIGIKPRTLQAWRLEKRGPPYITMGRMIRYRTSDVKKWLDRNSQKV